MCIMEKVLTKLYTAVDSYLGDITYSDIQSGPENRIRFTTKTGSVLNIVVVKRQFYAQRKKRFLFSYRRKEYELYEVYAEFDKTMPKIFYEVFSKKLILPKLIIPSVSEEKQVNAVVSAFLEIRLREFNKLVREAAQKKEMVNDE